MKYLVLYGVLSFCLPACTVDYTPDSKQSKRQLVVEGLVTTLTDSSRIKLSYTSPDFTTGTLDFNNSATVTVTNEEGYRVTFRSADKKGLYLPDPGYAAKAGKKYYLKIVTDGTTYEADGTLYPVARILQLDYVEETGPIDETDNTLKCRVRYYVEKPKGGKNFYKVLQYRNGVPCHISRSGENRSFVYTDAVLPNKINILSARIRYEKGDKARIDLQSISEAAYKFYNDLNTIQNNDGGMFTAPGANPISNISNGGMGFFQLSDNSHKEILIK